MAKMKNSESQISFQESIKSSLSFLAPAFNSGLNIMYLNLFGSDRGSQWNNNNSETKISENILSRSQKTLAITTQLIDLKKIKPIALLFQKNGNIENPK